MARNDNVACAALAWTQLTNGNATAVRVHNLGTQAIALKATVGATPPTDTTGAIGLQPGETTAADLTLEDLFPGVSGANRLYAYAYVASTVSVSHA